MHKESQEVFETVARHLFEQGVQSKENRSSITDTCLYRGPNNTKCAVGVLLSDGVYEPTMEGKTVGTLIEQFDRIPNIISDNANLLSLLQSVHDSNQNWISTATMKTALRNCVKDFNFDINPDINDEFLKDLKFKDR